MANKTGKKRAGALGGKQNEAKSPDIQAAPQAAPTLPGPPPPGSVVPTLPLPYQKELEQTARKRKQQKKKWTPSALPKTGKVRKTVATILAMKAMGHSKTEIAETLGLKPTSISQYLYIAGKNGWLHTDDPHEQAHSGLVHRVMENYKEWLHARDARTGLPDKEVLLESLKGLGIFDGGQRGSAKQDEGQMTNVLAIQITMPQQGAQLPQMRAGNDGGAPAYLDGEVVNVTTESRRQLAE